ncbi:DUF2993 domain-containing protein [Corynebacterium genitalium ATCC 33030]|uniref:DUF2993 domain-containing protein n=1 Tax=Corynebacterium genitalium ATCC 33030 TaxID=585529 RepID=D7WB72_9CORY|nr:LmeA family phospholipid-binding protein [Corynebacterium genitalium]EFK55103.1 hypothetical protein HMPREF0291_10361 [Corynebacterium genitalium ATCC 33030]UUA89628.1 DUF2993 domain-containing protein [Corynebacterium genitalium ATCC 33030]
MTRNYPAGPAGSRGSTGKGWKIAFGIIAVILVLFFIAELALRWFITDQIETSLRESAPESVAAQQDAEVHFGAMPVVFGLVQGKLHQINIDVPSTLTPDSNAIVGNPPATINATGFVLDSEDPSADELTLSTEVPKALVRDMLQKELGNALEESNEGRFAEYNEILTVSDVDTNPADGTFNITFSNGAFGVELRPEIVDNQLSFTAVSTQILGRNLPDFFSEAVSAALESGINDQVAGPLEFREFSVIDNGFKIVVYGHNVHLNELAV